MKNRTVITVIILLTTYCQVFGWHYNFAVGGLYYEIVHLTNDSANYVYVTHATCYQSVYVPSIVTNEGTNYNVISIAEEAFKNCSSLISVTISNSVRSIGNYAFDGCSSLSTIVLPDSIWSIGNYAFRNCSSLTSLNITNHLNKIGDYAFSGCSSLNNITIPDSVDHIGYSAFNGCTNISQPLYNNTIFAYLPTTYIGAYSIQSGITTIAGGAFENCSNLTSVIIPNSVTSIGEYAFQNCSSLTNITIPNSVTSIGYRAFYQSGITQPLYNDTIFIYMPSAYCGDYTIPSGITTISVCAFENCSGLTNVTIPNSVTNIGSGSFQGCSGLNNVIIPQSIVHIDGMAFWNCSSLTSVYFKRSTPPIFGSLVFNYGNTSTSNVYYSNIQFYVPCDTSSYRLYTNALGTYYRFVSQWMSYDFNVQSSDSTLGVVSISQQPTCNLPAIINATTTANHYHFSQWSDGNTSNPRTLSIIRDTSLTAYFAIDRHTITCYGANGSVTGGGTFDYGTSATLTAMPDNHYYFARWLDGDTVNPRSITVSSDTTYTAVFEGVMQTITVGGANGTVTGGGSYHYGSTVRLSASANLHYHFARWTDGNTASQRDIVVNGDNTYTAIFEIDKHTVYASGSNGAVTGTGEYDYGSTATLTATPNEHYHFARWSDGDTRNPRIDTVYANKTLTAIFEIDSHRINVYSTKGTVTGDGTYNYGELISLTATPDDHYHFVGWSDGDTLNPRPVQVTGDSTFTAVFEIDRHTVLARGDYGTVTGTGEYDYGSNVVITAVPDEHYWFVGWGDGDTSSFRTVTVLSDTAFEAVFDSMVYTIATIATNGTTTGDGEYKYTYLVTLTATADEGYRFTGWSDGSEYNPYIFEAVEDVTLEAYFEKTVGVENVTESAKFYYSNGWLYNPEGVRLYLYSTEGKLVKTGDADVDMTGLPEGVYFVRDEKGRTIKIWK